MGWENCYSTFGNTQSTLYGDIGWWASRRESALCREGLSDNVTLEHRPAGSEEMPMGVCEEECSKPRVASPKALRQEHCGWCRAEEVSWEGPALTRLKQCLTLRTEWFTDAQKLWNGLGAFAAALADSCPCLPRVICLSFPILSPVVCMFPVAP